MPINPKINKLIDEIRQDKTHGASELARQAATVLKTAAKYSRSNSIDEFLAEQQEIGQCLLSARPAMAPVFNIAQRLLDTMSDRTGMADLNSARQLVMTSADELVKESQQAITRIARYGSSLINDGDKIMTHSYSSTVIAVLKEAFSGLVDKKMIGQKNSRITRKSEQSRKGQFEVIVTRSGPGRSGETTARELGSLGIPVTFVDDAAVGLYISMVNKVIVGADRICSDGGIVNGIGTYQLALTSQKAGVPFYVMCDTLKFDPRVSSNEVELEEKEADEVVEPSELPPGVLIKNPYFDITPLELVTAVVTENDLLTGEEVITYIARQSVM